MEGPDNPEIRVLLSKNKQPKGLVIIPVKKNSPRRGNNRLQFGEGGITRET